MTVLGIFVLLALLAPLAVLLMGKRYHAALCYGVFLLVSQSRFLVINLPGGLPNLTIHRLTLIMLLMGWFGQPELRTRVRGMPFRRLFTFWMVVGACSMLGASSFGLSLRSYLSFVIEVYLLYLMLSTSVTTERQCMNIAWSVFLGLSLVAVLAVVERYSGVNPLFTLNPGTATLKRGSDVIATMDHRILLGAGMAMGWPLGIGLLPFREGRRRRFIVWAGICLLVASCYFSMSRGPWMACAIVGLVLLALLPGRSRRPVLVIVGLMLAVLVVRPGVWETLTLRTENTFAEGSLKHSTFMYRFELWRIAYAGIEGSPWRWLFGNGPGAAGESDFDWTLSYSGSDLTVWSWDNHFAALLYNTGVLGLLSMVLLLGCALWHLLRMQREADDERRIWLAAILASTAAYVFMMTNVFIFAPQLSYVFWSLVAAATGVRESVEDLPDGEVAAYAAPDVFAVETPGRPAAV